jgi:SAM-dependent methyltransferase
VLKQQKFSAIKDMLGPTDDLRCLDIGGDNGVVSLLLRRGGGSWTSVDLDEASVDAIRRLVGEPVHRVDGRSLPFPDRSFDAVVVVDFLEHVHTDREFAAEMARVLRPGGTLVVNVPHIKSRSVLTRLRPKLGLTDEKHGHVRAGYTLAGLRAVLGDEFQVEREREYCGSFSEGLDIALNAALERRSAGSPRSAKGALVTGSDLAKLEREYRVLSAVYPALRAWSALDVLLPLQSRYRLIVRARRLGGDPPEPLPASRAGR